MSYQFWPQDQQNESICQRNTTDWLFRKNYLYNSQQCNQYNQNFDTYTHQGYNVCTSQQDIRPIDTESTLYGRGVPFLKDVLSLKESNYLQQFKKESNKTIYKDFFSTGVNSICYPNIDTHLWDNVTKVLYTTQDIRK